MKPEIRNPYAKVLRSSVFKQRVVQDKRKKEKDRLDRKEIRDRFGKLITYPSDFIAQIA